MIVQIGYLVTSVLFICLVSLIFDLLGILLKNSDSCKSSNLMQTVVLNSRSPAVTIYRICTMSSKSKAEFCNVQRTVCVVCVILQINIDHFRKQHSYYL